MGISVEGLLVDSHILGNVTITAIGKGRIRVQSGSWSTHPPLFEFLKVALATPGTYRVKKSYIN